MLTSFDSHRAGELATPDEWVTLGDRVTANEQVTADERSAPEQLAACARAIPTFSPTVSPRSIAGFASGFTTEFASGFTTEFASGFTSGFAPGFASGFTPEPPPPSPIERLWPYLEPQVVVQRDPAEIAIAPLPVYSQAMLANAYFFGHPRWSKKYLNEAHRGKAFCDRWHQALRRLNANPFELGVGWNDKVVVDLGCGPGNLFAALGGQPATLIGVDISYGALRRAQQVGYLALLADAHHLPLRSEIADVVVANALLHHCDDMARVLSEAACLVKPGGYLITDLDPQRSAWHRQGWGLWLEQCHWLTHWPTLPGLNSPLEEQAWRIATEIHNRQPGVGLEAELYRRVLEPFGFEVQLYPHNHQVGAEIFLGERGRSLPQTRLSQHLSGLDPEGPEAAQSIMCVAHKHR
ncbi:MAG: class I SAM-dependent methyltransferase [Synechococcales cyanobacterium CRU_2_2]|nr:class I SAM-dependent methyltransferase [Synechococcales cyanobacterium CRU_2_2]